MACVGTAELWAQGSAPGKQTNHAHLNMRDVTGASHRSVLPDVHAAWKLCDPCSPSPACMLACLESVLPPGTRPHVVSKQNVHYRISCASTARVYVGILLHVRVGLMTQPTSRLGASPEAGWAGDGTKPNEHADTAAFLARVLAPWGEALNDRRVVEPAHSAAAVRRAAGFAGTGRGDAAFHSAT